MEKSIEDAFRTRSSGRVTFLPEPTPRERRYTLISVDDHIVEPPDMFEGRLPAALQDRAPRIVTHADGSERWIFGDKEYPNIGLNAVAGRPPDEYSSEPATFSQMRRGCWDIHARIRDMDINGVYASLNFPSMLAGFAGQRFSQIDDPVLGLAVMRAWNDWQLEEWAAAYPGRMIPCQLTWIIDPEIAAEEIRRNADRGFKAVTFSENPERLGLPSIHSRFWDPFLAACEETETVLCLHVGSSSSTPTTSSDAPPDAAAALFPMSAWFTAVDWLYSKVALRYPDIKIVLSEGGITWVPALLDRLDHSFKYHEFFGTWVGEEITPSELLRRNFWFCAIDDPTGFDVRHRIGIDHIMIESDYPHGDGTWPDTQAVIHRQIGHLPANEIAKITYGNAAALFNHPLPSQVGLGDAFPGTA